jgi:SAM-dependent methyltransferase
MLVDTAGLFYSEEDDAFDRRYPVKIERLSPRHWTPVQIARRSAKILVRRTGDRILDIGCGPGKFCAVGALSTEGHFTGVEQRPKLADLARRMIRDYAIPRVEILHANIMDISFAGYQGFYIYNPFQENTLPALKIDGTVETTPELYHFYVDHVRSELAAAPPGTRVVTYHGVCDEIPSGYVCEEDDYFGLLKLWVKEEE